MCSHDQLEAFLNTVFLPKLSANHTALLEKPITIAEVMEAIKSLKQGSARPRWVFSMLLQEVFEFPITLFGPVP